MKRLLLIVPLLALAAACSKNKDPDPPAKLVEFEPRIDVRQVWSTGIGGGTERLRLGLRPAVDGERLYVANHDGEVFALQANNGRVLWRVKTKLPLSGGPGVGAGRIVVGSSEGDVIALSETDGKQLWKTNIGGEVLAPPAVSDALVAVRAVDGTIRGLDVQEGRELWVIEQQVPRLSVRGTAAPVITDEYVIVGFDNGKVLAIDRLSGNVAWEAQVSSSHGRTELERLVDIDAAVRVAGNDVYVVGFQGKAAMLALESGQVWWSRDASSEGGLALSGDAVIVSGANGEITALNRRDGTLLWEQPALHRRSPSGPGVDGPTVVVGDFEGYLHWLDVETGEFLARESTGGRVTTAPVVANDMVYVLNDEGRLAAYRRGETIARRREEPATTEPEVAPEATQAPAREVPASPEPATEPESEEAPAPVPAEPREVPSEEPPAPGEPVPSGEPTTEPQVTKPPEPQAGEIPPEQAPPPEPSG